MLIKILLTILILSFGGFCIGMLWGLYLGEHENHIELSKIKIQDKYKSTPPTDWKMRERWDYYRTNNKLRVPIVIDEDNILVDGYTSYLIAKAEGLKKVEVYKI